MKSLFTAFFLFVIASFPSFSATISGYITDATNGQPLESVTIFVAGTTSGTVSDAEGRFSLDYPNKGTAQLVLTHIGYEYKTMNIDDVENGRILRIILQEKPQQLSEVNVIGIDPNRKENMKEFLFGFFGDSQAGKKCKILNPDVLKLSRNFLPGKIGEYIITATADSALIIENKLLGYTIRYTLECFHQTKYETTFQGYPLFIDNLSQIRNPDRIIQLREQAYLGSPMHFFRSLHTKKLDSEGFKLYQVKTGPNTPGMSGTYGLMADSVFVSGKNMHLAQSSKQLDLSDKIFLFERLGVIQFNEPFEVRFTLQGEEKAYRLNNLYHNGLKRTLGQQTTLVRFTDGQLLFYPNGSYKISQNMVTIGYWSYKKVGEILPWDYQPPKTAKQIVTLH
jgi:hypothetical protein